MANGHICACGWSGPPPRLCSRQVVGWQLGDNMQETLVGEPLEDALLRRRVKPGMIVHSDRGGQYLSHKMKKLLKAFRMKQSMSRADDPHDNAWAESFWSRLKAEPKGNHVNLQIRRCWKIILATRMFLRFVTHSIGNNI
ncbi:transposase [Dyadobacter sp. BHUBP1]|uniref:transposase n=1 Tax=Dyadobacter sp. BHUBP1 TaxID=3424178 RepID=UPI003D3568CF